MESTNPTADGLTVADYLRPVLRFKVPVVLIVILAAIGTYLYVNRETKVYQSSTTLYVGQSALETLLNPSTTTSAPQELANQAGLLQTPAVANVVRKRLGLPDSPEALLGAITVSPSSAGNFLTITAQSSDPRFTAELANGFAQAFVQLQRHSIVRSARTSLASTEARLSGLPRTAANSAVRQGLQQQISTLEGIVAAPPSTGQQLTPAAVPSIPVSPNPKQDAIFAAVIALALGVIASYLIDRQDKRVRRREDVDSLLGLPVLASIPHARRRKLSATGDGQVPEPLREAFRSLRVNLELARADPADSSGRPARVIMIASAVSDEGKSTIARNLALSYQEAGARVAVVEADFRRPVLAGRFGLYDAPGLSEALAEDGLDDSLPNLQSPPTQGRGHGILDVLVAGRAQDHPTVLLGGERFAGTLERLAADYDLVLIDSPPLLPVSDSLPLLGIADGVLLVVRPGTSNRVASAHMRRTIDRVTRTRPVRLLGVVVNDTSGHDYYYHAATTKNWSHPEVTEHTKQAVR